MSSKKLQISKNTAQTAKRLLKYVTETYKLRFFLVFICIFISSGASISVSLSLKFLLDDFIIPLIGQQTPDFAGLYRALGTLACIFVAGVLAAFTYTRLMVYIGQGVLKRIRDDMFEHMQTLPIRYFDQNTTGSIMSLYTNAPDDQPVHPPGAVFLFYDRSNFYLHAGVKPCSYGAGCTGYCCHAFRIQKDRRKQRKIFCAPAGGCSGHNRLCGRADERPESG